MEENISGLPYAARQELTQDLANYTGAAATAKFWFCITPVVCVLKKSFIVFSSDRVRFVCNLKVIHLKIGLSIYIFTGSE